MSRLPNKKQAGYYPTPGKVVKRIIGHVTPPESGVFCWLDPAAGEGRALARRFLAGHHFAILQPTMGTGKCVAQGTLVPSERGMLPIEALDPSNGTIEYPRLELAIQTPNGPAQASHFYNSNLRPVVHVQTRMGFELRATYHHPLLVLDKDGVRRWRQVQDLQPGDYVAIQRHGAVWGNDLAIPDFDYTPSPHATSLKMPTLPIAIDAKLAYTLGLLVGDGSMRPKASIILTTADPEIAEHFARWAETLGIEAVLKTKSSQIDYAIHSIVLKAWLNHLGLDNVKANKKTVPSIVLKAPRQIVRAFLQGLFDSDGSADKRGGVDFCTTSETLARQVHVLLLQFGIVAKRRRKRNAWIIAMTGDAARQFYANIGFRLKRKQMRATYLPDTANTNVDVIPHLPDVGITSPGGKFWVYLTGKEAPSYTKLEQMAEHFPELKTLLEPYFFWDRVKVVQPDGMDDCYDLTVPNEHAFIANGFVSHNTTTAAFPADVL